LFPLEFACRYFDETKNDYIELNFSLVDGLVNKASSFRINVYLNSKISRNNKMEFKTDLVTFIFIFYVKVVIIRFYLSRKRKNIDRWMALQ
jgi:hypothetical protein